jgi:hypothetical protein
MSIRYATKHEHDISIRGKSGGFDPCSFRVVAPSIAKERG